MWSRCDVNLPSLSAKGRAIVACRRRRPKRLVNAFVVPYDREMGPDVVKRLTLLACLLALGLSLGGCTKCGFIWDDWKSPAKSCRDEAPKPS
jgi:hypothetical protein